MPTKLINYPFKISSNIYIWLKPYSDIDEPDEPDEVIKQLLISGACLKCNLDNIDDYSKELTRIRNRLYDVEMWQDAESIVKVIKTPEDVSRKQPYFCEVQIDGGFYLKPSIKTEVAREFIKRVITVGMESEYMTISMFHHYTDDAYLDYEETLIMAYDSIQILSDATLQFGEPVEEERHES
ncbi:MAG: hypothetical protein OQK75_14405 [Gammaproteobacteria bacterium]|nr:hypothetical protein [Gammaproteobacteria bacterium]